MKNQINKLTQVAILSLCLCLSLIPLTTGAQQRFPKPEFENGYVQPQPVTPEPRSNAMEYVDVVVLLAVMSLAVWLALRKRSRAGIMWLSVFSLIYFGFYRQGCVCSPGSLQNMVFSLTNKDYAISISVLLIFLLPLIFSLFFGRVFCGTACPLGVIQDLIIIKHIRLSSWVRKTLGLIPYLYLALAVLYAATGTDFMICRYDPFINIYRMNGPVLMVLLGIAFLLMGMFIGRPYCRFLCPYGVLLNWTSRFSRRHLSITPAHCIKCKLCTVSCPFDAIDYPSDVKISQEPGNNKGKLTIYALLIPLWMLAGGFTGYKAHTLLSNANPDVYLAELMIGHPEVKNDKDNIDVQTFLSSGKTMETLVDEVRVIRIKFLYGSIAAGIFIGLVIGLTLLNQLVFKKINDYQPRRSDCYSCGRCMDYCPVKKKK
jgi:NosR/NirI family transcriptional regulator, nitrous oxide reductase regulator